MTELTTERLALQAIQQADVDALHHLWIDPEVRRYLWDGTVITRDQVNAIVSQSEALFAQTGIGLFALRSLQQRDELIGFCGLRRFADSDDLELRYGMLPHVWGQGLITEAAHEVLCFGFQQCALQRVVAVTDTPNQRAVRVLQRLGMSFAQRREYRGLDTMFYALSREEFMQAQDTSVLHSS